MPDIWLKRIGSNRGRPRIWLEGPQAVRAGFAPGDAFEVEVDGVRVVLRKNRDGSRSVSSRRKTRQDGTQEVLPIIDVNSADIEPVLAGLDTVRVVVTTSAVYLLPLASEVAARERLQRLTAKLLESKPLAAGSLAHGGGLLAKAIHDGLHRSGIDVHLAFANEIREDLLVHAMGANPVWPAGEQDGAANALNALCLPMQELAQDEWALARIPKVELLEMGLPCSGASRAGKSKRGLEHMEQHPEVGHLVHAALVILQKAQAAVVLLENVVDYSTSASADILRNQLRDMGYQTHEAVLRGRDFGCLEDRVRWCLVAVTRGVEFSWEQIAPAVRQVRCVADIVDEDIAEDDPRWRSFDYLFAKRSRDEAKGNGFRMQVVRPSDTAVPVLRKGYHKGGSTDPLLQHPSNPNLYRLFTAAEHARIKAFDPALIEGLSSTDAHQMLGQGIVYAPFEAAGARIGQSLIQLKEALEAGDRRAFDGDHESSQEEESSFASQRMLRMTG